MARMSASRVSLKRITDNLKTASRKGDRAALTLAIDQMKLLALSPRYWEKYLRSEERRVGKECRYRCRRYYLQKNTNGTRGIKRRYLIDRFSTMKQVTMTS